MPLDMTRICILGALVIVLGVPFLFRPDEATPDPNALSLVIITPHNEQIRSEFAAGFDRWHRANYDGQGVIIDWRTPGGTSDIRKQIFAEYAAAYRDGTLDNMSYDLLFGGGSYEHKKMKSGPSVQGSDEGVACSVPLDFTQEQLDEWFGDPQIGRARLYDADQQWFGTALSAFGIVYNRDVLRTIAAAKGTEPIEPRTWSDLAHPDLQGWVALANPGQSGSICTTFEVILQLRGWSDGWKILREAGANSRYFADSSSKVPIDVSIGEAAAGMCIDFYGRYQSQSIERGGGGDRVAYIDPFRESDIDPDPVSMLRGAPHPQLARRFIEFCLSEEGQALWQFEATGSAGSEMGPTHYELRRMPIRRIMYERYLDRFVDKVNPFELARPIDNWDGQIRTFIPPLFSAMCIDTHHELQEAWRAINEAGVSHPDYEDMMAIFHSMPDVKTMDGDLVSLDSPAHLKAIQDRWRADPTGREAELDRIAWTAFFRDNYRRIVEMASRH